jgi:hypothetical protein
MTAGCSSGSCDIWREALRMHNAHGYYTLSLAPMFTEQVMSLEGLAFANQLRAE